MAVRPPLSEWQTILELSADETGCFWARVQIGEVVRECRDRSRPRAITAVEPSLKHQRSRIRQFCTVGQRLSEVALLRAVLNRSPVGIDGVFIEPRRCAQRVCAVGGKNSLSPTESRQHSTHNFTSHVSQPHISSTKGISQSLMIKPQ